MSLVGKVLRVDQLHASQRDEMWQAMRRHYRNCIREVFDADLDEKQWVVVAQSQPDGAIVGFSTQMLIDARVDGEPIRFLFSGDTIVDPQYWSQNPLAGTWGRLALALLDDAPQTPLHWFLISKGYRTYRYLPVFFHDFFPRHDLATPCHVARLIELVAQTKFGPRFDAATGVVRAASEANLLREGLASPAPSRLTDPHVAFFCQQNPGHALGDELCCLAPIARENFKPAALRVMNSCAAVELQGALGS